ncbi:VOC family protein [Paenibacillus glacialis]|uniref:Glyoxalase n=1 Tax=Paenibacillus glacialis TaxID=494026 RepID=A0A168K8W9_9BACL|nr:VOC family protein [Paenibacillus glacialis]OAB41711.1 glyoxalase [Paenibacillus glacialis]
MRAQITVITILTNDVARLTRFYRDTLGFHTIVDTEEYVEFENSGVRFSICSKSLMAINTDGQYSFKEEHRGQAFELCFPCDSPEDVIQTYSDIITKGATPIKEPTVMPWGQTTAFFADPEGNIHSTYAD